MASLEQRTSARQWRRGYVMCIDNDGYPASLEVGKVYHAFAGETGIPNWIRVVDESGEDYLWFIRSKRS